MWRTSSARGFATAHRLHGGLKVGYFNGPDSQDDVIHFYASFLGRAAVSDPDDDNRLAVFPRFEEQTGVPAQAISIRRLTLLGT